MADITPHRLRAFMRDIEKLPGIDACWMWRGSVQRHGYGVFLGQPAYRVAFEWLVGEIPTDCEIDHLCRVRACVNPHHLEPVSRDENRRRVGQSASDYPRDYCRRGHALVGDNVRIWTNGVARRHCYACHQVRESRKAVRHAS